MVVGLTWSKSDKMFAGPNALSHARVPVNQVRFLIIPQGGLRIINLRYRDLRAKKPLPNSFEPEFILTMKSGSAVVIKYLGLMLLKPSFLNRH
jgi:hypothetical protein